MKTAAELAKKPEEFFRTSGVNYATFTIILEKVEGYVKAF